MHHQVWHKHKHDSDAELAKALTEEQIDLFVSCYRVSLKPQFSTKRSREEMARRKKQSIMQRKS